MTRHAVPEAGGTIRQVEMDIRPCAGDIFEKYVVRDVGDLILDLQRLVEDKASPVVVIMRFGRSGNPEYRAASEAAWQAARATVHGVTRECQGRPVINLVGLYVNDGPAFEGVMNLLHGTGGRFVAGATLDLRFPTSPAESGVWS